MPNAGPDEHSQETVPMSGSVRRTEQDAACDTHTGAGSADSALPSRSPGAGIGSAAIGVALVENHTMVREGLPRAHRRRGRHAGRGRVRHPAQRPRLQGGTPCHHHQSRAARRPRGRHHHHVASAPARRLGVRAVRGGPPCLRAADAGGGGQRLPPQDCAGPRAVRRHPGRGRRGHVPPSVAGREPLALARRHGWRGPGGGSALTREVRVLGLVALGHTNAEVATLLWSACARWRRTGPASS